MSKKTIARTRKPTKRATKPAPKPAGGEVMTPLARTDMLGLVALAEEHITDAIDLLGLDNPAGAALELAKALATVRAIEGDVERHGESATEGAVAS